MSDDHAAWATGCYGARDVRTPHLDALAQSGCRLLNAFTPSPVCSPARASFFTGRLPSQHGIHDWLLERPECPQRWLEKEINLAELLQTQGYRTGLVGKWHCGDSASPQPGFDFWLSYAHGQYPHSGSVDLTCQGEPFTHHGDQSPYLTDRAIEFMQEADARPYFLFVSMVDAHSPFTDHPVEMVDPYRDSPLEDLPHEGVTAPGWVKFGNPTNDIRRREWAAQYYAGIAMIDQQVGRLVAELKRIRQIDNTVIVYTSDHGHMNGHHGLYTKGNATVPQNFYDEAIRVPLLISHPASVTPASTAAIPVDHCDLFQTLCDYAKATPPADRAYPGQSFRGALSASRPKWRDVQFCEYGNARMIRTSEWKFIQRFAPHAKVYPDELYRLSSDPRETVNLICVSDHTPIRLQLQQELGAHFATFECPKVSGRNILSLPAQNAGEPWRLNRPADCPPEGTSWRVLDHYPA